jgi:hypothetical protein
VSRRTQPVLSVTTGPIFTAAAAWTALGRAGFRMVEWVTPGPGAGVGATLAARLPSRSRAARRDELPLGIAVARASDRGVDGHAGRRSRLRRMTRALRVAVAAAWADPATWYNALKCPGASTCEQ